MIGRTESEVVAGRINGSAGPVAHEVSPRQDGHAPDSAQNGHATDGIPDVLRFAVVGCGYWGGNYLRIMNEVSGSEVVGVCDQRPERLREIASRLHVATTTEIRDLLERDDVNAMILCTEATSHFRLARLCLEAGKHLLVEKPLTTTTAEADELIRLARENGLTLMVGHTFLYNPAVRKIKEYVVNNELGRVYYLYARRTNLGPIRHDVNAVWDLASHDVSIFNYLLDSTPEWVSAVGAKVLQNGREDVGFASLGYANGVVAHVHVSWADPNKVREVVVVGSDRRVVFNDVDTLEKVRIFEKGVSEVVRENGSPNTFEHHLLMRDGDIISPQVPAEEPLKTQFLHFMECIATGSEPLTGGPLGREVVRTMLAIDRSIRRQGAPVDVI